MKIKVEQKDIVAGISQSTEFCPVALAIKRTLKTDWVAVGKYDIFVKVGHKHYYVPTRVKKFISAFDNSRLVKPFSFILKRKVK